MKKINKILIAATSIMTAAMIFSSCGVKNEHIAQVVDYRNKNETGTAIRAARAAVSEPDFIPSVDFKWKLLDTLNPFDGEIGYTRVDYKNEEGHTIICNPDGSCFDVQDNNSPVENKGDFEKMKAAISFEDSAKGVKLVFKKPADYDNVTWIVFQYIDGNGNRSTLIDRKDWGAFFDAGDFEIEYPLVVAGKKANFWVMLGNEDKTQPGVNFFYEVMPAHGLGVVDDMQKDYRETDYISIEEGHILNITKVIPPYAKNVTQVIQILEQNSGTYAWEVAPGESPNKLCYYVEVTPAAALEAAEKGDKDYTYSIDLLNIDIDKDLYRDNAYIFGTFIYGYEMTDEKFDGYFFQTPEIKSLPVSNIYFKTDAE